MRTLHLVLIGKWYDMIASGEKKEEYRALTPYWCNKLIYKFGVKYWNRIFDDDLSITFFKRTHDEITKLHTKPSYKYEAVCFHRGYTNITINFFIDSTTIDKGKEEWGAPKEPVFIIKLGKRL